MRQRVDEARRYLRFDEMRQRIDQMEAESARPDFWDNAQAAQEHMRDLNRLKNQIEPWEQLARDLSDAIELNEMAQGDPDMLAELVRQADTMEHTLESLETRALLKDQDDDKSAYLYIHAGAGGTESCDWAQMLLRMYSRWCEKEEYAVETLDLIDGEEAGIRSATLLVKGEFAYGMLKAEAGVHRLVRISPFDAAKRRHTSFCSVDVWPQVDDEIQIEIREEDLRIDTYRSSGAGGQHVNKTSSAVRITHEPTGIVVACQNERSQHQNKAVAMKMLRAKLYQKARAEQQAELDARQEAKKDISWGNQIRSYVFQPYQMVKDHRTGHETGNVSAVMDGAIDGFLEAYLRWSAGMGAATPQSA
ncbi:MAG TPA: peptide chain release factor 2 [Candidatus Sumerlaeota bacterium]|nr:peptide chain release factor 2 [Candidatus Sumerlaeota bacterium]HOR29631.1 peptide chain release factor 2 [Candidatus Sumerlaeota bacterium]HPK01721.1 peptide chain release factor 2 [Candidatus Sumerlaeota bacterium]